MRKPEFSIKIHKLLGLPLGRLFIPNDCITRSFLNWSKTVYVYEITNYHNSKAIWFFASVSEYIRLAEKYPHACDDAYTKYLLRKASTFFRGLKPPGLPDDEYLD
jgi:hypothetical protein